MESIILLVLYTSMTAYFLVSMTISEVRDIMFYKNNDWNFELDSHPKWKSYEGDSDRQISNRSRVIFCMPTGILFLSLQMLIIVYTFIINYNWRIFYCRGLYNNSKYFFVYSIGPRSCLELSFWWRDMWPLKGRCGRSQRWTIWSVISAKISLRWPSDVVRVVDGTTLPKKGR